MTLAVTLIERGLNILGDLDEASWDAHELLDYLSEGQVATVRVKPDAFTTRTTITLVSGTKQAWPDDCLVPIEVERSLDGDGNDLGTAPVQVEQRKMDRMVPGWRRARAGQGVDHYMIDVRDLRTFDVYPPQPGNPGSLEVVYAQRPDDLSGLHDELSLPAEYDQALTDYMLYRAHAKLTTAASGEISTYYRRSWLEGIGAQEQAEARYQAGRQKGQELR